MWTERLVDRSVQKGRRTGGAERCTLYGSNSLVTWEPGPSTEGRRMRRWKERQQWREKRKLIRCRNVRARARGPEYGRTGTMVPSEERDSLLGGGGGVPERRSITQDGRMLVLGSFSVKDNLDITSSAAPSDANFYSTLSFGTPWRMLVALYVVICQRQSQKRLRAARWREWCEFLSCIV